jgi:hypothetical protein
MISADSVAVAIAANANNLQLVISQFQSGSYSQ